MFNSDYLSHSAAETMAIAKKFAQSLKAGAIVFLQGELGAGKTVFVKGLAQALKVSPNKVNSPTFVLMNHYEGKLPIYHFDLYRLERPQDFNTVDFDEYFYGQGISVIEWAERLGANGPKPHYLVELTHKGEDTRQICISSL